MRLREEKLDVNNLVLLSSF